MQVTAGGDMMLYTRVGVAVMCVPYAADPHSSYQKFSPSNAVSLLQLNPSISALPAPGTAQLSVGHDSMHVLLSNGRQCCRVTLPDLSLNVLARMHLCPIPAVPGFDMAPPSRETALWRVTNAWRIMSTVQHSHGLDHTIVMSFMSKATVAHMLGQGNSLADRRHFAKLTFTDPVLATAADVRRMAPFLAHFIDEKLRLPQCMLEPVQRALQSRDIAASSTPGRSEIKTALVFDAKQVLELCFSLLNMPGLTSPRTYPTLSALADVFGMAASIVIESGV